MILPDVNVLVYAFRAGAAQHQRYSQWLNSVVNGDEPFAMSPQVLASMIRVVTNPRAFPDPDSLTIALPFAAQILAQPNCRIVQPGVAHWNIFQELCLKSKATGNLVQDAWLAALAIEHGCEWITEDQDFARFPGLRWRSIQGLNASNQTS